nr:S1 family peptidase [Streptomyces aidingensis]
MTAAATGLLALAACFLPGAAHAAVPAGAADSARGYSADELAAAGEAVLDADIGGTAWAVDRAAGKVVVVADATVTGAELARIRRGAGELADAVQVERTSGTLRRYLSGGEAIFADLGWRCSLGFNVRSDGSVHPAGDYFLTAGHCTDDPYGPTPPYPHWHTALPATPGNYFGYTQASSFPGDDYGLGRYDSGVSRPGNVSLHNGSYQEISDAANPYVGQRACRSGATTQVRCGIVTGLNYSVNYGGGDIVHGLIRTNICAEPGDSGGPLYSGSTALGLTSGGSGNCSFGGTTFFQPVVEALDAYGMYVY